MHTTNRKNNKQEIGVKLNANLSRYYCFSEHHLTLSVFAKNKIFTISHTLVTTVKHADNDNVITFLSSIM